MFPQLTFTVSCLALIGICFAMAFRSPHAKANRHDRLRPASPSLMARLQASGLMLLAFKSSKQIREEIAEWFDKAQAILDLAEAEKRELTNEEKANVDAILGSGKKGEATYKAGKIGTLEADLERTEKVEARAADLALARTGAGVGNGNSLPLQRGDGLPVDRTADRPLAERITIPPANRFRYNAVTSFTGPHAVEQAYIAGRFYLATLFGHEASRSWCKDHGVEISFRGAMSESSNELGGFLVPVEIEQAIIDLRLQYGVFRRNTRSTPMARDTKTQSVRKSGLTAYFVGENQAATESAKRFGQISLVAKKLMCLSLYSSELSEDSIIDIGNDLTQEIAYSMAYKEDTCGFLGDGTSTYGGMVGLKNALAAGSIYTAITGNTAFGTLDMADFEAMIGKLPDFPGINPKWYISKAGWAASMLRLQDAAGGNTTEQLARGASRQFLGYDVEWVQVMNSTLTAQTSTTGLVYFGDLAMASVLGNRRGISIMISTERYFIEDQIAIKGSQRFDIVVHSVGTASEAGAVVRLDTPGS